MKLSKNLSYKEATYSDTALRLGIDNNPTMESLVNLTIVANNLFQPIRDWMGEPLHVTSGYRSPELNKAIGGSTNSQHCLGQAIDIDAQKYSKSIENSQIFQYIVDNLEFDQLIWEFGDLNNPDWIHVSYSVDSPNRNEILRAYRENGKTKYTTL